MKKILKKGIYIILCTFVFGVFCDLLYAHSDGAPSACLGAGIDVYGWRTYPPRSTNTCGILGCHYQYPINSGKAKFKLFVIDKCAPGEIIDILVAFEKTDTDSHGFQMAAQDGYYNRLVGSFIIEEDENVQLIDNGLYVTHTKKGTSQKFWHVKWQAPPEDFWVANPVRFYAMGVEADNDGTAMGDYIYKATRLIVIEQKKKKEQIHVLKKE